MGKGNASGLLPKMRGENGEMPVTNDLLYAVVIMIGPAVLGAISLLIAHLFKLDLPENDAVSDPVIEAIQKELEERVLNRRQSHGPDAGRSKTKRFGNCPNCGAPVSYDQRCEYCGTYYET